MIDVFSGNVVVANFTSLLRPARAKSAPFRCSSSALETRFGSLWSPFGSRAAPRFLFLRAFQGGVANFTSLLRPARAKSAPFRCSSSALEIRSASCSSSAHQFLHRWLPLRPRGAGAKRLRGWKAGLLSAPSRARALFERSEFFFLFFFLFLFLFFLASVCMRMHATAWSYLKVKK